MIDHAGGQQDGAGAEGLALDLRDEAWAVLG